MEQHPTPAEMALTPAEMALTPAEMADACEVSIDTLRYYEKEGLLEPVERTSGGQRRYNADDVAWVHVLRCLPVTAIAMVTIDAKIDAYLGRTEADGIPVVSKEHR